MTDVPATPQLGEARRLRLLPEGDTSLVFRLIVEVVLDADEIDPPRVIARDPHTADVPLSEKCPHARTVDPQHSGDGFDVREPVAG